MTCSWKQCHEKATKQCTVELMSGKSVSAGFCDEHVENHKGQCHDGVIAELKS